jgi:hypothetical protein
VLDPLKGDPLAWHVLGGHGVVELEHRIRPSTNFCHFFTHK